MGRARLQNEGSFARVNSVEIDKLAVASGRCSPQPNGVRVGRRVDRVNNGVKR